MAFTEGKTSTLHAANNNAVTLGRLEAVLNRHVNELRALAASPLQRTLVARAAMQMIERTMTGVQS
ncbi:MAG: hypothetical protein PHI71_08545 [Acidiphilium sp.]|jgi:hypothetical protein|nr:hypothetical protein [Acidiphilium sp.]